MKTSTFRLTQAQTVARRKLRDGLTLALGWGRGTGKSWFMRHCAYEAIDRGRCLVALVSPTLKQCKQNHLQWMQEELSEHWNHLQPKWNAHESKFTFGNGSIIQFFGCIPKPSRGPRFDFVLVDECDDVDARLYHGVIVPWLSATWSKRIMILGGTPTRGRFGLLWEHRSFGLNDSFPDHAYIQSTAFDSPEITSKSAVLKAQGTTEKSLFAREWCVDFDSGNGSVFPMFDRSIHVRNPPADREARRVIVGCDHGFRDPTVFLAIAQYGSGEDAEFYVVDEYYSQNTLPSVHLSVALEWWGRYPRSAWFYDPSRPETIREYRNAGLLISGAKNAIQDGLATVAEFLTVRPVSEHEKEPTLYISPRCVNTIRELETYRRKEDRTSPGRFMDEPVDKDNHCVDALRYGLHSEFGQVAQQRRTR